MDSGVRSMADLITDYDRRVEKNERQKKERFDAFSQNRLLDECTHEEYAVYANDVMERVEELEALRSWLLKYIELCQRPEHKQPSMSIDEIYLETRNAKKKLQVVDKKLLKYNQALDAQDD